MKCIICMSADDDDDDVTKNTVVSGSGSLLGKHIKCESKHFA